MFASFHVAFDMCRIWKRKKTSYCRNFWFMLLYIYMLTQIGLSFIIVGTFYGVFSIFLRAILPSDQCLSVTRAANVLENIYLVFIFVTPVLSTSVRVEWAETGFRIWSLFIGLLALLMVIWSIVYATQETIRSISVVFLFTYILSYFVPLLMNITKLRIVDFVKGVVYSIYMTPTYINIFTIFAISNIHDISWGSRPSNIQDTSSKAMEKQKGIIYRNFRSNFLIMWLLWNVSVGFIIVYISRNGQVMIMLVFGVFLTISKPYHF